MIGLLIAILSFAAGVYTMYDIAETQLREGVNSKSGDIQELAEKYYFEGQVDRSNQDICFYTDEKGNAHWNKSIRTDGKLPLFEPGDKYTIIEENPDSSYMAKIKYTIENLISKIAGNEEIKDNDSIRNVDSFIKQYNEHRSAKITDHQNEPR